MVRRAMTENDRVEHFLNTIYQCLICGEKFNRREKFSLHVKKHREFKKKALGENKESSMPVETDTEEGTLRSSLPVETDVEERIQQSSMAVETGTEEGTHENEELSLVVRSKELDERKPCINMESFTETAVNAVNEDSSVPVEAETEEVENSTLYVEFSVHDETEEPEEMTLDEDREPSIPVESQTSKQSARDNLQCHLCAKIFDEENNLIEHLTRHSETRNQCLQQNTTGKLNYCQSPTK